MNLTQIAIFGVLSLGFGALFTWANRSTWMQVRLGVRLPYVRRWGMLIASIVALYWLQSSTPIRSLDFWLPTASLGLTLIVWAAINGRPGDLWPTLLTAGVIGAVVAMIA